MQGTSTTVPLFPRKSSGQPVPALTDVNDPRYVDGSLARILIRPKAPQSNIAAGLLDVDAIDDRTVAEHDLPVPVAWPINAEL